MPIWSASQLLRGAIRRQRWPLGAFPRSERIPRTWSAWEAASNLAPPYAPNGEYTGSSFDTAMRNRTAEPSTLQRSR